MAELHNFWRESILLPDNYESFVILVFVVALTVVLTPSVIELVSEDNNSGYNDLAFNLAFEYEDLVEVKDVEARIKCGKQDKFLIENQVGYVCNFQTSNLPAYPYAGTDIESLRYVWKDERGEVIKSNRVIEVDDFVSTKEKGYATNFLVRTPRISGEYYLNFQPLEEEVEAKLHSEPTEYGELNLSDTFTPVNLKVFDDSKLEDLRDERYKSAIQSLILLSIWFGGFSLIIKVNSEKESKHNQKVKDGSFLLIELTILWVAFKLIPVLI